MKKTIIFCAVCLTSLMTGQVKAEELSIQQCREMALENNKKCRIASLTTHEYDLRRKSMRGNFFPDFSLSATAMYGTIDAGLGLDLMPLKNGLSEIAQKVPELAPLVDRIPSSYQLLDLEMDWLLNGRLQMTQPIFMGGKIVAGYRMSKLAVELMKQAERKTEAEVLEEVDEAYAMVVKAGELKAVALKYQALLQELDKVVESAVRNGMKLQNERLKVQVKMNEVQLNIRRAENGLRLATMNLCHMIGKPLNSDITVQSQYPRVDDALSLQSADITLRPEYAMLQYNADIARQNIKVERAALMPQLVMLASYGYTRGLKLNGHTLLDDNSFMGGVNLNIPIYHFGERTNKLKAAKVKHQLAQLELQEKSELMELELTKNACNLDESQLECELAEKSLEQAQTNMELSGKLYKAGTETLSDYLTAQAEWQKAYESRVDAYFQRYLNSVKYLKSAGTLVQVKE